VSSTVADTLDVLAPHLPGTLLSARARREIQSVARRLPARLTECFGFELPLGDRLQRGDFAVQISTPRGRRLLAGAGRTPDFPAVVGDERAWTCIRRFGEAWCDESSPLGRLLASTWLEFDVDPAAPRHRIPSVFMTLAPDARDRTLECVRAGAELIGGAPLSPATLHTVTECVEALPPGAAVHQVGTMLSRRFTPLRLCFTGIGADRMPDYLAGVGLPGEAESARGLTESLLDGAGDAMLHLDVVDRLLPRIGVEYTVAGNEELGGRPEARWEDFLDRLVAHRLCTPQKRAGVLAWAGSSREQFEHQPCPSLVFRGLSHVKIDCRPGHEPVSKAYIGFIPDRLTLLFAGADT
jgi:hypothetical protein